MAENNSKNKRTDNHDEIKKWVEDRGGRPSVVSGTELLRIDFGEEEDNLEEIDWEEFFRIFDDSNLEFIYQEETADGSTSRFSKFVSRG